MYLGELPFMECQIGVVLPTPALVAGTLAVPEPEHVDLAQSGSTTERGEIGDSDYRAAGRDESFVHDSRQRVPAPLEIYGTTNVDLAVLIAADLIDTR